MRVTTVLAGECHGVSHMIRPAIIGCQYKFDTFRPIGNISEMSVQFLNKLHSSGNILVCIKQIGMSQSEMVCC